MLKSELALPLDIHRREIDTGDVVYDHRSMSFRMVVVDVELAEDGQVEVVIEDSYREWVAADTLAVVYPTKEPKAIESTCTEVR